MFLWKTIKEKILYYFFYRNSEFKILFIKKLKVAWTFIYTVLVHITATEQNKNLSKDARSKNRKASPTKTGSYLEFIVSSMMMMMMMMMPPLITHATSWSLPKHFPYRIELKQWRHLSDLAPPSPSQCLHSKH